MGVVTYTKFTKPMDPFHSLTRQAVLSGVPVIFLVPQDALSISANEKDVNLDVLSDELLKDVKVPSEVEQITFTWDAKVGFVRQ